MILIINVFFSFLDPDVPENVALVPISSTQLHLSWKTPLNKNGLISGYYITWRIVRNDTNHTVDGNLNTKIVNESTKSYNVPNLGKYLLLFWVSERRSRYSYSAKNQSSCINCIHSDHDYALFTVI